MALRIPTLRHHTRQAALQRKSDFDVLFDELLATRRNYEELRMANAAIADRADALQELHLLRAAMASVRREIA